MKKIKLKSTEALFLRFAGLALLLCLLILCLVTVQKAKTVQDQWEFIIGDFIYEDFEDFEDFEYTYSDYCEFAGIDRERINRMEDFDLRAKESGADNAVIFLENGKPVMESTSFGYIHALSADDWYSGQAEEALNNLNGGFVRDYWSQQPMVRMDLDSFFGEEHPILEQLQQVIDFFGTVNEQGLCGDFLDGFAGQIYAIIDSSNADACGNLYRTNVLVLTANGLAPKLMPTVARPNENLHLLNLNSSEVTEVRVFSTSGELMETYNAEQVSEFVFKAATLPGYYLVEVQHNGEQTTLRYIVK